MYTPLPIITEALDDLGARPKRERDGQRRIRLHLLVLIRSGQVQERQRQPRAWRSTCNTIGRWLKAYQEGGLEQLLELHRPGAKLGQKTLSPPVLTASRSGWTRRASPAMSRSSAGSPTNTRSRSPTRPCTSWCGTASGRS